jgi:hypothetical protein
MLQVQDAARALRQEDDVALSQETEELMATDDDFFIAFGRAITGFNTFVQWNNRPCFRQALGGLGSTNGAYGRAGLALGPQLHGPFVGFAGVFGESHDEPGTAGTSVNNIGVYGQTEELERAAPHFVAGVYGAANSRPGVIGFSKTGNGVVGLSETSSPAVFGFSTENIGVVGKTNNADSLAGLFDGNVLVNGALTANVKNAVVAFPDGTERVLHCMESPEHWFEDFGTGRLTNGRTIVNLDADFAKVVELKEYHVFVTPEGDCHGVCACNKTTTGFEVRELQGGTSNVAFSYRIVARRKDIKAHQRFAKVTRPPAEATRVPRPPTRTKRRAPAPRIEVQDGSVISRKARERRRKGAKTGSAR